MADFQKPCPLPPGTNPVYIALWECILEQLSEPAPPAVGDTCENPTYAEICNLDDLVVAISEGFAPFAFVCDEDGNKVARVYVNRAADGSIELFSVSFADGTITQPFTGETCLEDVNGAVIKTEDYCTETETYCLITYDDASTRILNVTDPFNPVPAETLPAEAELCEGDPQKAIACWKDTFIEGGIDARINWRWVNQVIDIEFSDGSTGSFTIASATGWNDLWAQFTAGLDSIMPWAGSVDTYCTNGCGGLPTPETFLSQMRFRYTNFRVCAGEPVPVRGSNSADGVTERELIIQFSDPQTVYYDRCIECGDSENATFTIALTGEDATPTCPVPCTEQTPETPEPVCTTQYIPGCDNVNEPDDDTNWVNVLMVVTDCGDGPVITYGIEDAEGNLEDYELVGDFVDCLSGELVEEPQSTACWEYGGASCCYFSSGGILLDCGETIFVDCPEFSSKPVESSKAVLEKNCETGEYRWYDPILKTVLTPSQESTIPLCEAMSGDDTGSGEPVTVVVEPENCELVGTVGQITDWSAIRG